MIKISDIKLPAKHTEDDIVNKISKILNLRHGSEFEYKVIRRSIDARKKPDIFYIYCVAVTLPEKIEQKILNGNFKEREKGTNNKGRKRGNYNGCNISKYEPIIYIPDENIDNKPDKSPVIVGEGPAGLFAGLILAYAGFKPIIIERGDNVDNRIKKVNEFWESGRLDKNTNVQFGEGGAGTFSDGKLNTGVKDPRGLNQFVLDTFVKFGADKECAYSFMPHVGTDRLASVVKNIRNEIVDRGGRVFFGTRLTGVVTDGNKIKSIIFESADDSVSDITKGMAKSDAAMCPNGIDGTNNRLYEMECDDLILAIGHSARDTFRMLYEKEIPMQQKDFAVGLRIQHPQELINETQYGKGYKDLYGDSLPPASYKLTNKTRDGRSVFSFCMCPGGYVVNASSADGRICVNGMSNSKRDSETANSAIIVSVTKDDFDDNKYYNNCYNNENCRNNNVFAGMELQEMLEKKAFIAGSGKIPIQKYDDYCNNKISESFDGIKMSFKGETQPANLRDVLPESINSAIIESMEKFGYTMKGLDDGNAVLAGVESRTSSPVRILRDESMQSSIRGIYPCGEGAGYAGGIMSAAIDGIKVAEAIIKKYNG